ncbi:MAG: universal stress protein [Nitrosopumilus sp.]|nr:universal stress protein [Nitrosopumilus sp.]MDH3489303.1 universal stress protein [Nitrosopumilus sp.]MDH3516301.1 universal stress protein [Nitrosopumilus sp.]MDH3564066.1 universal stress protein [Nitrosopumilus sp.]MDH5417440.1 universal stress protein [Nitrosopumilus sp.]
MQSYEIKKILVPLDGSQNSFRGLEKAIYFARQCDATLTGLYISQKPSRYGFDTIEDLDSFKRKQIDTFLEKAKNTAAKNGTDMNSEIIHGSAKKDILNFANRWNYDLIVIGSKGAGSSDEPYLGSVANHILHTSKIPVLIVK